MKSGLLNLWRGRRHCREPGGLGQTSSDYLVPEFLSHIDPERVDTIFELGARDGRDAILLAEHFGSRLFAFECNPHALPDCRRRLAGREHITLVEKAVWDREGTIPFYPVVGSTWRDGRLIEPWPGGVNAGASSCYRARDDYLQRYVQEERRVEAIRLDRFCREQGIKAVDLLCIDLQGAMLRALRGMGDSLATVRYLIAEIENREIYHGQALFPEIDRYLQGFGLRRAARRSRDAWFKDYLYLR